MIDKMIFHSFMHFMKINLPEIFRWAEFESSLDGRPSIVSSVATNGDRERDELRLLGSPFSRLAALFAERLDKEFKF